eukprot:TRINITY_DN4378_c0_g1_i1.p1 TRINITY_DN4378_c0_g1~~TRINITY_DN4378_c0_g1_i1.p1  ORF type:complete len:2455 (+),score=903.28 TRINITY_DN4378_c0_g1_i1:78-7442(+)
MAAGEGHPEQQAELAEEPAAVVDPWQIPARYRYFAVHLDTDTPQNVRVAELIEGRGSFRDQFGDAVRVLDREGVREWFAQELPKELQELEPPAPPPPQCKKMAEVGAAADPPADLLAAAFHCRVAALGREFLREEAERLEGRRKEAERREKQRKEYTEMGLPTDELDAQDAEAAKEDAQVPAALELSSPEVRPELAGVYRLQEGEVRGQPWWRKDGGGGWLSDDGAGRWAVSQCEGHFSRGFGWVRAAEPHGGAMPHKQTAWEHTRPGGNWQPAEQFAAAAEDPKTIILLSDFPRTVAEAEALQQRQWLPPPAARPFRCHCMATVNSALPMRGAETGESEVKGKGKPAPKAAKAPPKKGKQDAEPSDVPKVSLHQQVREQLAALAATQAQSELRDILTLKYELPRLWFGTQLQGQRENSVVADCCGVLGQRFDALEGSRRSYELWAASKLGRELTIPCLAGYEPLPAPPPTSKAEPQEAAPPAKKPAAKKGKAVEEPEAAAEPEEPPQPQQPEPPADGAAIRCHRGHYDDLIAAVPDSQMSVAALLRCMVEQVARNDECRGKAARPAAGAADAFGDDTPREEGTAQAETAGPSPQPPPSTEQQRALDAAVAEEQQRQRAEERDGALDDYIDLIFGRLEGEGARVVQTKVNGRRALWAAREAELRRCSPQCNPQWQPGGAPGGLPSAFPIGSLVELRQPSAAVSLRREEGAPWGLQVSGAVVSAADGPAAAVPIGGVITQVNGAAVAENEVAPALESGEGCYLDLELQLPRDDGAQGVVVGHGRGRVGVALPDGRVRGVLPAQLAPVPLPPAPAHGPLSWSDAAGARARGACAGAAVRGETVQSVERAALELLAAPGHLVARPGLIPDFGPGQRGWQPPPDEVDVPPPTVMLPEEGGPIVLRRADGSEEELAPDSAEHAAVLALTGPLQPGGEPVAVPSPERGELPPLPPELAAADIASRLPPPLRVHGKRLIAAEEACAAALGADPTEVDFLSERHFSESLDRCSLLQRLFDLSTAPDPPVPVAAWRDIARGRALLVLQRPVPEGRLRWHTAPRRFAGRIYFPTWLEWRQVVDEADAPPKPPPSARNLPEEEQDEEAEEAEAPLGDEGAGEEEGEEREETPPPPEPVEEPEREPTPEPGEPTLWAELQRRRRAAGLLRLRRELAAGPQQPILVEWAPGAVNEVEAELTTLYPSDGGVVCCSLSAASARGVHCVAQKDAVVAGFHVADDPVADTVVVLPGAATSGTDAEEPHPPPGPLLNPVYCTATWGDLAALCVSTWLDLGGSARMETAAHYSGCDGVVVRVHCSTGAVDLSREPPLERPAAPGGAGPAAPKEGEPREGGEGDELEPDPAKAIDGDVRIRELLPQGDAPSGGRRCPAEVVSVWDPAIGKEAPIVTREVSRRVTGEGVVVRHFECGTVQTLLPDGNVATLHKRAWLITRGNARTAVPPGGAAVELPPLACASSREPEGRTLVTARSDLVVRVDYDEHSKAADGTVLVQHADGTRMWRGRDAAGQVVHRVEQEGLPTVELDPSGGDPRAFVEHPDGALLRWFGGPAPEVMVTRRDASCMRVDVSAGQLLLLPQDPVSEVGLYRIDYAHGGLSVSDADGTRYDVGRNGEPHITPAGGEGPPDPAEQPTSAFSSALRQVQGTPAIGPRQSTLPPAPERLHSTIFPKPQDDASSAGECLRELGLLGGPPPAAVDGRVPPLRSHPPAVFSLDLKAAAAGGPRAVLAEQLLSPAELGPYMRGAAADPRAAVEASAALEGVTEVAVARPQRHVDTADLALSTHHIPAAVAAQRRKGRRRLNDATQAVPSRARLAEFAREVACAAAGLDAPPHGVSCVVRALRCYAPMDPEARLMLRHHVRDCKGQPGSHLLTVSGADLGAGLLAAGLELSEGALRIARVDNSSAAAAAGVRPGWTVSAVAGVAVRSRGEADAAADCYGGDCPVTLCPPEEEEEAHRPPQHSAQQQQPAAPPAQPTPAPAPAKQRSGRARGNPVGERLQQAQGLESAPPAFWQSVDGSAALDGTERDRMKYARAPRAELAPQPPPQEHKVDASPHGAAQHSRIQAADEDAEPAAEAPPEFAADLEELQQQLQSLAAVVAAFPKYSFEEARTLLRRPEASAPVVALLFSALLRILDVPPAQDQPEEWRRAQQKLTDPRHMARLQRVAQSPPPSAASAAELRLICARPEFTPQGASAVLLDLGQLVSWLGAAAEWAALARHIAEQQQQPEGEEAPPPGTPPPRPRGHRLDVYGQLRKNPPKVSALRQGTAFADPNLKHLATEAGAARAVKYSGNTKEQSVRQLVRSANAAARVELDPLVATQSRIAVAPAQCNFGSVAEGKRYALELSLTNMGQLGARFMIRRLRSEAHERINELVTFVYKKGPIAPGITIKVQVVLAVDSVMRDIDETIEVATEAQIVRVPLLASIRPASEGGSSQQTRKSVRCLGPTRLPAL